MSIHYSLEISGPTPPAVLSERLCSLPEYHRDGEDIIAPGLLVRVSKPGPLETATIEEEFEFTPLASVTFRWYGVDDPVATRIHLIQACMALLEDKTDDAVLLLNGETVILLRKAGRLVLNPVEGFWTDEVLAAVSAPHEFESLRNI